MQISAHICHNFNFDHSNIYKIIKFYTVYIDPCNIGNFILCNITKTKLKHIFIKTEKRKRKSTLKYKENVSFTAYYIFINQICFPQTVANYQIKEISLLFLFIFITWSRRDTIEKDRPEKHRW